MSDVIKIEQAILNPIYKYSICTIVSRYDEYEVMKKSFVDKGFVNDCEYIIADNTIKNEFDAYQAITRFLKKAKGEFIIIVHQDVELVDDINVLTNCLNDLQLKDPNWALCGNAGLISYENPVFHISHKDLVERGKNLPTKVKSLDENLLIVKASSNLTISPNLTGFHLYGTDLCIIANFLGYSNYVIEFMLIHYSKGNIPSLKKQEHEFIEKYGEKMELGYVQTTCTQFYLSNSLKKNKFFNSKFIFSFILYYHKKVGYWRYFIFRKKRRVRTIYKYLFGGS